MPANRPDILQVLAAYRTEVLRWNTQINLVSRRDTEAQLDALILQCDNALAALQAASAALSAGPLLYCDLGSGGGLPGVVWHARLAAAGRLAATWLVEPRDKRAWFLQRVARQLPKPELQAACARWGDVEADGLGGAESALVSLKALRLSDPEVLAGLETLHGAATPPRQVVIARFHPGDAVLTPSLADELRIVPPGRTVGPWVATGARVVPVPAGPYPAAALVVSSYGPAPA